MVVLCLALVATACQDTGTQGDDPAEPASLPSIATSGSTGTPSTPEIAVDAPTDQDHDFPLEFSIDRYGFFPDALPGSAGAAGSGCVIGQDVLPDGMWFGFVEAVGDDAVSIDIACFWTGDAAITEAEADGNESYDFYIRNTNPKTRPVPSGNDATGYWLDGTGDLTPQPLPLADWPSTTGTSLQDCPSDLCAVWVYVNGGVITELIEQYLP